MPKPILVVLVLTLLHPVRPTNAVVQTNALFSDGMVLQTSADAPLTKPTTLHGTASPGEKVILRAQREGDTVGFREGDTVGFPGAPYSVTAATDGTWSMPLQADVTDDSSEALVGSFT